MTPDPNRRSIRLPNFDYASAGAYFVTICAYERRLLFEDENLAQIVRDEWSALESRFAGIQLDEFVVMPNHVHGIVWLVGAPLAGAQGRRGASTLVNPTVDVETDVTLRAGASPSPTLGAVVGAFKSRVAVRWLQWVKANAPGRSGRVWQRNYYERVIRNESELARVREYIRYNPMKWDLDRENPGRRTDPQHERDWGWLEARP
ncbi:MAG: transposase [Dehalococcoidia bacterium]|nr:transposase [Dehalococcoidia bacterium]